MFSCLRLQSLTYALIALCCCSISSAELNTAEENPSLQIRTIDVAPYGFESTNGHQGIYYDLAHSLAKKLINLDDIKINHRIYPYARIIHELKTGQTDLTIMFKYEALKSHVTYISPLPSLKNVVIGLKDSGFKKVSDLEGKKIAYLRGAKFSDLIDHNDKIIKITTHNFHQGIDMLMAKRVDAIIGPIDPIMVAAQKFLNNDNLLGQPLIVSTRTPWLQISNASKLRNSTDIIKKHFNDIMTTGELQVLRNKYLSNTSIDTTE